MKRSRWNELLGVPDEIRHPNLYQILGLDEHAFREEDVAKAFRERMQRVQSLRSTKHKEFIEFVKGELRRGLRVLGAAEERAAYDRELVEERTEELRRILVPTLAAGVLVGAAEKALLGTAVLDLGMREKDALAVIEAELARTGAVRVDAPTLGAIPVHEGLTPHAAAELARVQAERMAKLAFEAAARAREALAAAESQPWGPPLPLEVPSDVALLAKPKKTKKKKGAKKKKASSSVLEAVKFCASCGVSIPARWQKTGEAERVGARLLCSSCSAPIRAGRACAGCSRELAPGEKVVSVGGSKRICATCAVGAHRLKVCAGCGVILPRAVVERGDALERDGRLWCKECAGR